jgi:hypothetical protein
MQQGVGGQSRPKEEGIVTRKPIAVFQLELEYAPLLNVFMRWHWRKRLRMSRDLGILLLSQLGRRSEPLAGRPQLLVTRYSSKRPDQDSAGSKLWLDALVGLGWLKDDSPDHVEVLNHWEKASPGQGRVVVHVYSGEQANEEHERKMGWR